LEAQIRSFLNYLRVEKGLSDNTMYAYQRDMMKFAEFAAKQKVTLAQVERAHVVDFLRSLYLKKLDSRSVARHLVTIRHFFRFCFAEGLIQEDPAANVQSPKFRQSLPEFLSLAEVDRLLAAGLPAGPVQSIDKALTSPHAVHRGDVVEKDWYKGVASPIRMGRSQASLRSVPPTFGQHTAEVLAEFGYSKAEIEGLTAEGVICTERRR